MQLVTTCDSAVTCRVFPNLTKTIRHRVHQRVTFLGSLLDRTVLFGEYSCKGPGASTKQRVPWSRALTYEEARPFLGRSFIDGEQWLKL